VIWDNRLVADAGEERTGRWLDEKIDLGRIYGEIWKDTGAGAPG
jgi:hypothetical protein